jgi:hypothetical protein
MARPRNKSLHLFALRIARAVNHPEAKPGKSRTERVSHVPGADHRNRFRLGRIAGRGT